MKESRISEENVKAEEFVIEEIDMSSFKKSNNSDNKNKRVNNTKLFFEKDSVTYLFDWIFFNFLELYKILKLN